MTEAFSASRIATYQTCPRLYYFQYVEKLEQPKHILTLMGSALHKSIETFYQQGTQPLSVFSKEFYGSLRHADTAVGLRGKESPAEVFLLGQSILEKIEWTFKPIKIEMGFNIPFPSEESPVCNMRGFIDMVLEGDILVDHKSSKTKPTKKKLSDNIQFLIYMWAYNKTFGKFPEKMYWHHLRTQELIEVSIDNFDQRIEALQDVIIRIQTDATYDKIDQNGFCRNVCNFKDRCWGTDVETNC